MKKQRTCLQEAQQNTSSVPTAKEVTGTIAQEKEHSQHLRTHMFLLLASIPHQPLPPHALPPQPCSHGGTAEICIRRKNNHFFFSFLLFKAGNKDMRLFLAFLLFIQDLPNRLCDFYAAFFSTKSFERQNNRRQIRKAFGSIGPRISSWYCSWKKSIKIHPESS